MNTPLLLNKGVLLGTASFRLDGSDNIQFTDGLLMSLGDHSTFRRYFSKEEHLFAERIWIFSKAIRTSNRHLPYRPSGRPASTVTWII